MSFSNDGERYQWLNTMVTSPTTSPSTYTSAIPGQIPLHIQPVNDLIPDTLSLSPETMISDHNYRDTSATIPSPSHGHPPLGIQLGAIPQSEEDEEDETRDQLAGLPRDIELDRNIVVEDTPSIDTDQDHEIVSDFMWDTWDDNPSDNFSQYTIPPSIPEDQGMPPLRRVNTTDSVQSRISVFGLVPLSRTLTSVSSWSTRLDHVRYWEYTLEEWGQKIRDSISLRTAEIVKVDRYIQKTRIPHRFLVLQLRRMDKKKDIFLRLDRRPVPGIGFVLRLGVTPANDCALLAADEKRAARGKTPANIKIVRETSLDFSNAPIRPTLYNLEHLLHAMSRKMREYQLTKENCWFFCAVCLRNLSHAFGGNFDLGEIDHAGLSTASKLKSYAEILGSSSRNNIFTPTYAYSVAVSPDGNYIVSGHFDNSVLLWNAQTGKAVGKPLKGHSSAVHSVAFSPDGRWIVSGSMDKTIRLWDAKTQSAVGEPLRGHSGPVASVAFSPDGERIVSGSSDGTARLWNRATGVAIGELLKEHDDSVASVAFSPDGQMIASASMSGIRLWDALTGNDIRESLGRPHSCSNTLAFSPNGQHIASGSYGEIRIWSTATGIEICDPIKEYFDRVNSLAYSPDGRYIASGSNDGAIRFWNATTGASLGVPLKDSYRVPSVAFFPDGRRIASCGSSGSSKIVYIWDAPF